MGMADLIDRWRLLGELRQLKQGWAPADYVMDKVFQIVKAQPAANVKTETFLEWRDSARSKETKRREAAIALYDIMEHTNSGLLED